MSGLSSKEQFKLDFSEWEWRMVFLEDCPHSEVEEIRQTIRDDWMHPERREYWIERVVEEAAFSRDLKKMGRDVEARIRARIELERSEERKAA